MTFLSVLRFGDFKDSLSSAVFCLLVQAKRPRSLLPVPDSNLPRYHSKRSAVSRPPTGFAIFLKDALQLRRADVRLLRVHLQQAKGICKRTISGGQLLIRPVCTATSPAQVLPIVFRHLNSDSVFIRPYPEAPLIFTFLLLLITGLSR